MPLAALASGIYLQAHLPISMTILVSCLTCASLILLILCLYSFQRTTSIFLVFTFLSAGGLSLQLQLLEFAHIRSLLMGKKLTLYGTILDKESLLNKKQCLTIGVDNALDTSTNQSLGITCTVQCYTNYPTKLMIADQIVVQDVAIPSQKDAIRFPSFNDYLTKENIHASFFLLTKKQIFLKNRPDQSYARIFWNLREKTYQRIKQKLSPLSTAFLGLLFLGKKKFNETDSLRNLFNEWGLAHYLARSGLHIVLLMSIWSFLLAFIPLNLWIKRFFLVAISIIYACLSWTSTSFFRALWVFMLASMGKLIWQHVNILHLLSLICLIMLILNPINLFFLDFQLTFCLTLALLLSNN